MQTVPALSPLRLPRYHRVDGYPPVILDRPKQLILGQIARFHYLTARQLTALLFSKGSLTYVHRHCKELYHGRYLRRLFLPLKTPFGSSPAVYALDSKGYRYVKGQEVAPYGRFRASEQGHREDLFLQHTLAANDFLVLTRRLASHANGVSVAGMLTEREMKRDPAYVNAGGERICVVPDGWLKLVLNGSAQMHLALELDRGTVEKKSFKRKIRAYVPYVQGLYQQKFAAKSLTVLFLTLAGGQRLKNMLAWTQDELTRIKATSYHDLFRFAAFNPAEVAPLEAFFSPQWLRPFDSHPQSLIGR